MTTPCLTLLMGPDLELIVQGQLMSLLSFLDAYTDCSDFPPLIFYKDEMVALSLFYGHRAVELGT